MFRSFVASSFSKHLCGIIISPAQFRSFFFFEIKILYVNKNLRNENAPMIPFPESLFLRRIIKVAFVVEEKTFLFEMIPMLVYSRVSRTFCRINK